MAGLNDEQVHQQIQQMVAFIDQEAQEKAEEIRAKADEEFNIEKARLVQDEKLKLQAQFERKAKQVDTKQKIEYSNKLNAARLRVLKAQEEALKGVVEAAAAQLKTVLADKPRYKALLESLLAQSLCQLLETQVTVRVCKADVELVKSVVGSASKIFEEKTKMKVTATVDESAFLPDSCGGGVEVAVSDRIKVTNTLENRLEIAVQQLMPAVRHKLFGVSGTRSFFS